MFALYTALNAGTFWVKWPLMANFIWAFTNIKEFIPLVCLKKAKQGFKVLDIRAIVPAIDKANRHIKAKPDGLIMAMIG